MKKLIALLVIPLFLAVSCKKVEDTPATGTTSSYKTMTDYMVSNNMDLDNILTDWIVAAPATAADVPAFIAEYDILDIRDAAAFAAGHIEGATNSSLATIVTDAAATTKPILVACYTGQTAAHAVVALKLSGFQAKTLKWGMSGWRADLAAPWEGNSGPTNGVTAIGHTNWVTTATTPVATFSEPDLTLAGSAEEMLKARITYMTGSGFKGVTNTSVLDTPSDYFINNFWDQVDVDHYGHIGEAYRIKPLTIANGEMSNIDASKTVVTYCWTGQTSSMVTAYLNVIGYNAVSLKFGTNGMIYTDLQSHQFVTPTVDLPVVQ
jgi:rhodanese-related sulfurtransferase